MPRATKTAYDRFLAEQMQSASFAGTYTKSRAEIHAVDRIVRALDEARIAEGMSKAALARVIACKPELVRRFFTQPDPNPTLGTATKLAAALGCRLGLVPLAPRKVVAHRATNAKFRARPPSKERVQHATLRGTRRQNSSPRAGTSADALGWS